MTGVPAVADGAAAKLLVNGRWIETGEWHEVRSPSSGEVVARVPYGNADLAREAVDAAATALATPLPAYRRAQILEATASRLSERREEIARQLVRETGKPLRLARMEADRACDTLQTSAVEARRLTGEMIPMDAVEAGVGKLAFTLRVPIGVVGAITPFNFPLNLVAHKVGPAIAAGCPVVLKPADKTPLSALALAECATEAGLPPGWLNVILGPAPDIGEAFVADERVRLITFTGSAEVGWMLRERGARKRVLLELGNSTPVLVHADADLEAAASKIAASGFSFAGQSCISTQRVYVHADVYESFLARLVDEVQSLGVGDPEDDDVLVGPVIDEVARDRILAWIDEAKASGAKAIVGGTATGLLVKPTVLVDADIGMKVSCREVFGPVITVTPYKSLDQAIELANSTPYGLQAGIFTRNISTATDAMIRLDFGGVTINETPTFRTDPMPYGGVKQSGTGKEGPAYAVREMTEERLVVIQL